MEDTRPQGRAYYPALDGLRAVSFFAVFFWHYLAVPYGWAGVDVFFVLSGFLITGILFDTRDDPNRVINFYIRRTLRIFPLYYAVFLGLLLVSPLLKWIWSWQWLAWPLYLGNFLRFLYPHQHNNFVSTFADAYLRSNARYGIALHLGHFWTLCIEEQFYLVWPWIVFKVRERRTLIYICTVCIVLVPITRSLAVYYLPKALIDGEVVLHSTPFRFDTLMVGALIALIYRGAHRDLMQHLARIILPIATLCLVWSEVAWYVFHSTAPSTIVPRHPWFLSVIAIFAGALMLRTLVPGTIAYRIFNLRWLRLVGTVSYGAYIFHDIPHSIYDRVATVYWPNDARGMASIIGVTGTLVLAFLSYRYFEHPILRTKDRLTSRQAQ